jgi:type II secretory pathway component PulC
MKKLKVLSFEFSLFSVLTLLIWLAGCVAPVETKQTQAYQTHLGSLQGKKSKEVLPVIIDEWKFEVANQWEGEQPAPQDVNKVAVKVIKFSEKKIQAIFSEPGHYKVMVFSKVVGSTSATTGEIDSMGFPLSKDSTYVSNKYCVVRLVFRNDILLNSRVWGNLDRGRFIDGTTVKRF